MIIVSQSFCFNLFELIVLRGGICRDFLVLRHTLIFKSNRPYFGEFFSSILR